MGSVRVGLCKICVRVPWSVPSVIRHIQTPSRLCKIRKIGREEETKRKAGEFPVHKTHKEPITSLYVFPEEVIVHIFMNQ